MTRRHLIGLFLTMGVIHAGVWAWRRASALRQDALNRDLLQVARRGNSAAVDSLVDRGADVNARDERGYTALTWAAYEGHADTVKALTEKGADPNARNEIGHTVLIVAAGRGYTDIVNYYGCKARTSTHKAMRTKQP